MMTSMYPQKQEYNCSKETHCQTCFNRGDKDGFREWELEKGELKDNEVQLLSRPGLRERPLLPGIHSHPTDRNSFEVGRNNSSQ